MNNFFKSCAVALSLIISTCTLSAADLPVNDFHASSTIYQDYGFSVPYRLISSKAGDLTSVELDDGSIWKVVSGSDNIRYWRTNDSIVIYPVLMQFWYGATYYLYNERTGTSANVELSFGPVLDMPTNNQVIYLDYYNGELQIQDGSGYIASFIVDYIDMDEFQYWKSYQSIILGANEGSWSGLGSESPYILINVERNKYIRARRIY